MQHNLMRYPMSTVTLLDLLAGNGALLLPFFTTKDAKVLKQICKLFASIIKAHPWHDTITRVYNVALWRNCFPNATACLVVLDQRKGKTSGDLRPLQNINWIKFVTIRGRVDTPSNLHILFALSKCIYLTDAYWSIDPFKLRCVRELATNRCQLTDAHLAHLRDVRVLNVGGDIMVTDRGVQCLKSVRSIELRKSWWPDGPPVDPPVLTDAAIDGLPIEHLRLDDINCQFTLAGFAQLPLRYLALVDLDIRIPVGQLKALVNLSFLQISRCPLVELGDEDIVCMQNLTQLVVDECPMRITGRGILQLVIAQIKKFDGNNFLERLDSEPGRFDLYDRDDWDDMRPRWWRWTPPPHSLYNRKEWPRIVDMRKARNDRNQPCLYQVGIALRHAEGMECTFEDRNKLLLVVPFLGIPPRVFDPNWDNLRAAHVGWPKNLYRLCKRGDCAGVYDSVAYGSGSDGDGDGADDSADDDSDVYDDDSDVYDGGDGDGGVYDGDDVYDDAVYDSDGDGDGDSGGGSDGGDGAP